MAKRYSVAPMLRPGAKTYSATFRNCMGARVTRSLDTQAFDRAKTICSSLVELWNGGIRTSADVPVGMLVQTEAHRLYFPGENVAAGEDVIGDARAEDVVLPRAQQEVERFPEEHQSIIFPIIYEQLSLRTENVRLLNEVALLKRDLHTVRTECSNLKSSILGRAAATAADMPRIAVSVERFRKHIHSKITRGNARQIMSKIASFILTLPAERVTMMDVRFEDIGAWLDIQVANGREGKRAGYRDSLRRRLGRFVNWCAATHDYPSQMAKVTSVKKDELRRERGDIHWHELKEVKAAIAALENEYWRALVSTLAYAGLQLAELAWLRVKDVNLTAGRIWIATVEDDQDTSVQHALKTAHRRRSVQIHPKYLLPALKQFKKKKMTGEQYFFAMPKGMRRQHLRQHTRGREERWIVSSLNTLLLGKRAMVDKFGNKLPHREGLLPKGMSAKSLRRTFGSLMLRSGKTTAEVAAAMGNTEDVVREPLCANSRV